MRVRVCAALETCGRGYWSRAARNTALSAYPVVTPPLHSRRCNEKFVLVSEACLPLYPPVLFYTQVMGEPKARINACRQYNWADDETLVGVSV